MKKLLLILLCLPMIGFGQNVNIPDANFKAYLVGNTAINTNGDTEIQLSEANSFNGSINCTNMNIADLTGIEDFTALITLYCSNNQLTTIDLSQNTALDYFACDENQFTSIDVSQNTSLTSLICNYNQLTSLNLSGATALTNLHCSWNQLTNLDVSQNIALTTLGCLYNQLTTLDVSSNTSLFLLNCDANQLTSLDVTNNWNLTGFSCHYNQLTSLDVTNNWNLTGFSCHYNQLTSLDVSQNTALTELDCDNNQLTSLDVSANTALTILGCSWNLLTSLDVSPNTALTNLYCKGNPLTSLDVSTNTDLNTLVCANNQLTSLDLSNNTNLVHLQCQGNSLTSLDVRNGNNTNFNLFQADNNPSLYCIDVDDPTWSNVNWTNIDSWASFSSNCATAIYGCTDPLACNYDPTATIDDGSCIASPTVSYIISDVSCYGTGDGIITVAGNGGTSPYIFDFGGVNPNSLFAGIYNFVVTDANGCSSGIINYTINEPNQLVIDSVNTTLVSCSPGNDGTAIIYGSGGMLPYTYGWSNSQTTQTSQSLASGTYTAYLYDATNCQAIFNNVQISSAPLLNLSIQQTAITCTGVSDGTLTASILSGTAPVSYQWFDLLTSNLISSTNPITGLPTGVYSLVATDAYGCTDNWNGAINNPIDSVYIDTVMFNNVSCNGFNDGCIYGIVPIGGTAPYQYSINGGPLSPSWLCNINPNTCPTGFVFCGLAPAVYDVEIWDANGCANSYSITITEPVSAISLIASATANNICLGEVSTINVSGNTGLTYSWDNGLGNGSSYNVTPIGTTTYTVTGTDINGCSNTDMITVTVFPIPIVIANASPSTICYTDSSTLTANGASTFSWNNGLGNGSSHTVTPPIGITTYNVTGTDVNGCSYTDMITVTVKQNTSSYDTLSVITSIVWNGLTLNGSGDYSVPLINAAGCDSIANLNLTVTTTSTWDCIGVTCVDPGTGMGIYSSLSACQVACVVVTPSWDCIGVTCVDPGTGMGIYSSLSACQTACVVSTIKEHTTNKKLLKVTDLLGRETKGTKNEVLFYIYDDGTVEKRIVID